MPTAQKIKAHAVAHRTNAHFVKVLPGNLALYGTECIYHTVGRSNLEGQPVTNTRQSVRTDADLIFENLGYGDFTELVEELNSRVANPRMDILEPLGYSHPEQIHPHLVLISRTNFGT